MPLNSGAREDSWKSLGQQGDQINQILKEINPEYSLEGLMLKLETPILWPPYTKNWLIGKAPDARKDWRWEEKGLTEDEMVGCITDSVVVSFSKLQELVMDREAWCALCPWGCKESDTTEQLNWTNSLKGTEGTRERQEGMSIVRSDKRTL